MKTCIIVLNWNGADDTLACLESLHDLLDSNTHLIICDNASSDNSLSVLQTWCTKHFNAEEFALLDRQQADSKEPAQARVVLLRTERNRGFSAGHNAALSYALQRGGFEYVWLLNNDLRVDAGALQALQQCARQHPRAGMFGSTVLDYDHSGTVQCAGGCRYYPWLTVFRNQLAGYPLQKALHYSDPLHFDYIYGAAMFIRVEAVRRTGLLNEDYFLFYEELDYAQRLRRSGYTLHWCRASLVYHKGGASLGSRSANRRKLKQANYYETLSTLKYTTRFHPRILWFAALFRLTGKSALLLLRGRLFLLPPLWEAYRDFFTGNTTRAYDDFSDT